MLDDGGWRLVSDLCNLTYPLVEDDKIGNIFFVPQDAGVQRVPKHFTDAKKVYRVSLSSNTAGRRS